MDMLVLWGVPVVTVLIAGTGAFFAAKARNTALLGLAGILWLCFTVAMGFGLNTAVGWDGLIYIAGLLGISAPSAVGLLIGGVIGIYKREALPPHATS